MNRPFDRSRFYTALTLLTEAKMRGLENMGLIKIKLEADALTSGLYPSLTIVNEVGRHYEYIGDDFAQGLDALRKLIAKAKEEQEHGKTPQIKTAARRRGYAPGAGV